HNSSCGLRFDGGLQSVYRTAFRSRANPGVSRNVGCQGWVALAAAHRVRRQEKFHALDVSGWCACALVHVTATDPLCARRHPDLVGTAIVADRCAYGVAAVEVIIARLWRIVAAGVADAVVDGVVPVVIVIGGYSIPAAVVRLERVMSPPNTGIGAGNDDILPIESERPEVRRVRVNDSRRDGRRRIRWQRPFQSR